ncbi:MAG: ATP-dependent helicase [Planctomycetota bacterium]|jgi:DNA helicase-2/ATP-dependent DNA helicase PcrA
MRNHLEKLTDKLNRAQKTAVETTEGPVLVLAGAGTGKTRVITVRMAHLLSKGVTPDNILAMTFTNKAAKEMKERVTGLVGKKAGKALTVGTFHSFCVRSLRVHAARIDLPPHFSICDGSDQISAVKGAMRDLHIPEQRMNPRAMQAQISLAKNRLQTPDEVAEWDELIGRTYQKYNEHLRRSRALDFDDLLLEMLRLLRDCEEVRDQYRERFLYIMVDEYQDTNGPQYEIVRQLAGVRRNLCVVGDDDQSIYGWRGADVKKILAFEKDFPGARVIRLETNYRSTEQILDAANRVIRNNPARHEKTLRSAYGPGNDVKIVEVDDEDREAAGVVGDILKRVRQGDAKLRDCAILFRTAVQPRAFESVLRQRNVPYVLIGGQSFFDRKEVRDVMAYLKLVSNPLDEVSLLRVVNCPPRGVGKKSLDAALAHATRLGVSVNRAIENADEIEGMSKTARTALADLQSTLGPYGDEEPGRDLPRYIERLLNAVVYRAEVDRCYPDIRTRNQRWQAVEEIFNFAENYARRHDDATLGGFLEAMTLTEQTDQPGNDAGKRDAVTLMTLHAAKGLEFPRVYLVGAEEGLLPHGRSVAEDGIEEERRLMYVGVTRAQYHLTITHAKSRARHGTRAESMPSRFLFEIRGETPPKGWRATGSAPLPAPRGVSRKRSKASRL